MPRSAPSLGAALGTPGGAAQVELVAITLAALSRCARLMKPTWPRDGLLGESTVTGPWNARAVTPKSCRRRPYVGPRPSSSPRPNTSRRASLGYGSTMPRLWNGRAWTSCRGSSGRDSSGREPSSRHWQLPWLSVHRAPASTRMATSTGGCRRGRSRPRRWSRGARTPPTRLRTRSSRSASWTSVLARELARTSTSPADGSSRATARVLGLKGHRARRLRRVLSTEPRFTLLHDRRRRRFTWPGHVGLRGSPDAGSEEIR